MLQSYKILSNLLKQKFQTIFCLENVQNFISNGNEIPIKKKSTQRQIFLDINILFYSMKVSLKDNKNLNLPTHIKITLTDLFAKYDVNKNGVLERNQIKCVLEDAFKKLGIFSKISQEDIDNFIKDYDKNHDGKVSQSDFLDMYAINFYQKQAAEHLPTQISLSIDQIFAKYDKDHNNLLDLKQLSTCLKDVFLKFGITINPTEDDIINFFKDYDYNGDGRITRDDFKRVYAIRFHAY